MDDGRPPRRHVYGTTEIGTENKPSAAKTSPNKLGKCWILSFFPLHFYVFLPPASNFCWSQHTDSTETLDVSPPGLGTFGPCPPTVQVGFGGLGWVNFQRPRNQFIGAIATFPFMAWNVGCAAWKHFKFHHRRTERWRVWCPACSLLDLFYRVIILDVLLKRQVTFRDFLTRHCLCCHRNTNYLSNAGGGSISHSGSASPLST